MNKEKFYINPHLVEIVETMPDTLITTMSGKKYYVLESAQDVSDQIMKYYLYINTRFHLGSESYEKSAGF